MPADEPLLLAKFKELRAVGVARRSRASRQRVPLLADITTLQLREFMLDSDVRTPAAGEVVFERNDYTQPFFSIVDGDVRGRAADRATTGGSETRAIALRRGRVLRRAGPHLRPAPRRHGQGAAATAC